MKAGKMVNTITVQTMGGAPNEYGTWIEAWLPKITLRAEIIEQSTEEFLRTGGAADEAVIVFRTRFVEGITNADRVMLEGEVFNIRQVSRIGRRTGLELRCVALEDRT